MGVWRSTDESILVAGLCVSPGNTKLFRLHLNFLGQPITTFRNIIALDGSECSNIQGNAVALGPYWDTEMEERLRKVWMRFFQRPLQCPRPDGRWYVCIQLGQMEHQQFPFMILISHLTLAKRLFMCVQQTNKPLTWYIRSSWMPPAIQSLEDSSVSGSRTTDFSGCCKSPAQIWAAEHFGTQDHDL